MPEPVNFRQLLEQQFVKTEKLKAQLKKLEAAQSEPIAILGMGCRFPGGGTNPEAFWRALREGVDGIQRIPSERWRTDGGTDEPPETLWGGFLGAVDGFDPAFFGIAPREAESLDPQQRLLLEVTWEALENAGQAPDRLVGSRTGVFVGIATTDYQRQVLTRAMPELDAYALTGNLSSVAAGRISYVLGLQGPCASIDTACSSSLVAAHFACQSLRNRECELAIVGGANLLLSPVMMRLLAKTQGLSPDGRCKAFDASANGFVRGEGCGVVVLKRLSDALRDGDPIVALIRGSAVNQDGRSTGLTAPNVLSQQALLRQALENARVSPAQIGYVEAHGTGTALGDPIEFEALKEVLGAPRVDGSTCTLGSVKTNIGHLEAAAGIAGLIKTVLALQHEVIPRHLHLRTLNPRISLDGTPFALPREERTWAAGSAPRMAGVSSFGISGTNAHLVLEEAPRPPANTDAHAAPSDDAAKRPLVLPLSARSPEALTALARAHQQHLDGLGDDPRALEDLVFTAGTRRTHHEHRLAVVGQDREAIGAALRAFTQGQAHPGTSSARLTSEVRPRVAFVFPGYGGQRVGMGRQLLAEEPVFAEAIAACDAALRAHVDWSVTALLRGDPDAPALQRIDVVQPALFAIAIGLSALWRSWGVTPDAVVGHSVGEVAAAHVAGVLGLEDAARLVCHRSRLLHEISGQGAMGVVELTEEEATARLAGREHLLSIAVINSPRSIGIAGDPAALDALLATLEAEGIFCRRVKVDVAAHSPKVDPLVPRLVDALGSLRPEPARCPLYSTVTGALEDGGRFDAAYWGRNLREPVQFARAVQRLHDDGITLFVELGPHPVLLPAIESTFRRPGQVTVAASMRREQPERATLLEAVGTLYTRGYPIAWAAMSPATARCAKLPTYPFQRSRYWMAPAASHAVVGAHPLLGARLTSSLHPGTRFWETSIGPSALAYLADHQVQGAAVLPASAYLEMAVAAAWDALGVETLALEQVSFREAMTFRIGEDIAVQTVIELHGPGVASFRIASRAGAEGRLHDVQWTVHATGQIRWQPEATSTPVLATFDPTPSAEPRRLAEALADVRARCATELDRAAYYEALADRGITYGPAFQGVLRAWKGAGEALCQIRLPEDVAAQRAAYRIHPALLDASFHVLMAAMVEARDDGRPAIPVGLRRLQIHRRPDGELWSHGRIPEARVEEGHFEADLGLLGADGRLLVEVDGLRLQRLDPPPEAATDDTSLLTTTWEREPLAAPADGPIAARAPRGRWLILGDDGGLAEPLAAALTAQGESVVRAVSSASSSTSLEVHRVEIDAPAAFDALLRTAFADGVPCAGILHLWALEATPAERTTLDSLDRDQRRICGSALHLVQGLTRSNLRTPPRLWFVTRGAQAVDASGRAVSVAQAPLWGLARTIWLEHKELPCSRVDLDPDAPPDEVDALVRELLSGVREDELALRATGRHVGRLGRSATLAASPGDAVDTAGDVGVAGATLVRADATYLVTGGLGGLGLSVAAWLVERGARHLALLGRNGAATAAQIEAVRALEAAGAEVRIAALDVADRAQLAQLLDDLQRTMPPLRGVLHAAGVIDDGLLAAQDLTRFHRVMQPKIAGSWNLHELTRSAPLDFFVLYSSAAALLGAPGQGNYAAANAFMDALAHHRRALGAPALSIAWGIFSEAGIAARAGTDSRLAQQGFGHLTPAEGASLLGRLLGGGAGAPGAAGEAAHLGVARVNLRQWVAFYPQIASAPRLARLVGRAAVRKPPTGDEGILAAIRARTPAKRQALVEQLLCEHVARVVRVDPARIQPEAPLKGLGIDSLMGLELRNRLESILGITLSATLVWTYPSIAALAAHLLEKLDLTAEPTPLHATPAKDPAARDEEAATEERMAALQDLTDDEKTALLDDKLAALEALLQ
ncbi:type I polyketide synthase [Chondromyces crocatus]|uniref:Polyketide synthase n=1 Tax=Chondromyces crocatus TaxID=52 RepID=A0A0K1EIL6_CHOCO|nr:type I polyketide synthase [Chondromyces crocatus]AKT40700.1 polyketide synthase [Chondromyces crocatus]